jgi:hypothetical protein
VGEAADDDRRACNQRRVAEDDDVSPALPQALDHVQSVGAARLALDPSPQWSSDPGSDPVPDEVPDVVPDEVPDVVPHEVPDVMPDEVPDVARRW